MRNVVVSLAWLSIPALALSGCADPCVDDGLGQKFCPLGDAGEEADEAEDSDDNNDDNDGTDDGDDDDDPGDGSGDGDSCPLLDIDLTPQTPTVLLLVDQSGSMTEAFDTGTRWDAVKATLLDANNGVVTTLQQDIRFGLSLYTGYAENPSMGGCPELAEAAAAINNYDAIATLLNAASPAQDTPTGESLAMVAATLAADTTPGDKHIVLATDGEPDTCAIPNPATSAEIEEARNESIGAAQAAFSNGIKTSIISVGSDVAASHLQDLANAGAGVTSGEPDAPFYQALDQQGLVDAFQDIISGVRECTITLADGIIPSRAGDCIVTVNGEAVDHDNPDGWELDNSTEMELLGAACDSIQDGTVNIQMECDCDALE